MKCPKCEQETLTPTLVTGVEVDQCRRCRGIWFDAQELSSLLRMDPRQLKPLKSGKENELLNQKWGACPRDSKKLLRVYSADNREVILDHCPACNGIWLDGGELPRLIDAD